MTIQEKEVQQTTVTDNIHANGGETTTTGTKRAFDDLQPRATTILDFDAAEDEEDEEYTEESCTAVESSSDEVESDEDHGEKEHDLEEHEIVEAEEDVTVQELATIIKDAAIHGSKEFEFNYKVLRTGKKISYIEEEKEDVDGQIAH